jgi:CRISPR-associated protein Cmr4
MGNSYAKLYWIHSISPLHIGAGQGLGFIDLPIIREKSTGWPFVPGSTVKGAWRAFFEEKSEHAHLVDTVFGIGGDTESYAGSAVIGDAHLAFLPVRSFYGTFAYVTSPLVLRRLQRDIQLAASVDFNIPSLDIENSLNTPGSCLSRNGKVFLEDLDIDVEESEDLKKTASFVASAIFPNSDEWQKNFSDRILVVPNGVYDYLTKQATEVVARVSLESKQKVVEQGPWYEESLPTESILMGVVWCDRVFGSKESPQELVNKVFKDSWVLQMGGNQTIGSGRVRCVFSHGKEV